MSDNIIKFYPTDAAKNPDFVLEQALDNYTDVLIIGYNKDDEIDVRGNLTLTKAELVWLMKKFEFALLAGEYDEK